METLEIRCIEKIYQGRVIFEPISAIIRPTEKIAVLGESGVGKSTLLKIIAGCIKPDQGTIFLPKNTMISMVFQENLLLEDFTAIENIQSVVNWSYGEAKKWLSQLSLEKVGDQKVKEFSGGMKRRLALLRALALQPTVLLLDEVFREVDEENKRSMINLVMEQMDKHILIFTTHNKEDVFYLNPTRKLYLKQPQEVPDFRKIVVK